MLRGGLTGGWVPIHILLGFVRHLSDIPTRENMFNFRYFIFAVAVVKADHKKNFDEDYLDSFNSFQRSNVFVFQPGFWKIIYLIAIEVNSGRF